MIKRCSKCKTVKPLEEFHKKCDSKDGFRSECKGCTTQQTKLYYAKNKMKVSERMKRYYIDNKEKTLERMKRYYIDNKEKTLERMKHYYGDNKEKTLERMKHNRIESKTLVDSHKTFCAICGETNKVVLDFHHRDKTEKLFIISRGTNRSKESLLKEMSNCEVLCVTHHKEFHHYERNPLETPQELLDKYAELGLIFKEKNPKKKLTRGKEIYREMVERFNLPCHVCGESRTYLIEFHHLNPLEKEYAVSQVFHQRLEKVLKEIEKTVCLCANCHRIYHNIYGWQKEFIARPEAYRRLDALKGVATI